MNQLNLSSTHLADNELRQYKRSVKRYHQQGFTLLEVLIAVAIFALISLAGFTILNTVLQSEERSKQRIARINEIQRAFLIMERDFLQITRRTIRVDGEKPLAGYIHSEQNNFSASSQAIAFVRSGWTNPGLLMPRGDLQSVAYRLNDNVLERLHFNFVDAVVGQEPKVRPLLSKVKELDFAYYDGKKWQKQLRKNSIPMAIAIELELDDYGQIRREFLVAGDAPVQKTKER